MKKFFTLIELLVVIAIIAILASMLLPALSRARYSAKNAVCIGQLKQIAQGWISYADDFDGYYPDYSIIPGQSSPTASQDSWRRYSYELARRDPNGPYAGITIDLRPTLRGYFGPLNDLMKCPLMPPFWMPNTGGSNIDEPNVNVTFGSYYTQSTYTFFPNGNPWTNYMSRSSGKPLQPMRKVGDFFSTTGGQAAGMKYRLLASDHCFIRPNNRFIVTQTPYSGAFDTTNNAIATNEPYAGTIAPTNGAVTMANYVTDDGAVTSFNGLNHYVYQTPRFVNSAAVSGWAGFLLPVDLQGD